MSATRESVMQELLEAASDSLRRKQTDEAYRLIGAYDTLARAAAWVPPSVPDSDIAIRVDGAKEQAV